MTGALERERPGGSGRGGGVCRGRSCRPQHRPRPRGRGKRGDTHSRHTKPDPLPGEHTLIAPSNSWVPSGYPQSQALQHSGRCQTCNIPMPRSCSTPGTPKPLLQSPEHPPSLTVSPDVIAASAPCWVSRGSGLIHSPCPSYYSASANSQEKNPSHTTATGMSQAQGWGCQACPPFFRQINLPFPRLPVKHISQQTLAPQCEARGTAGFAASSAHCCMPQAQAGTG